MDKYIHFKSKVQAGQLKLGQGNTAYYSEEEPEDTPSKPNNIKKSNFSNRFQNSKDNKNTFDTDDENKSDDTDNTPEKPDRMAKKERTSSIFLLQKGSQSAQQHQGDKDEAEIEELTPKVQDKPKIVDLQLIQTANNLDQSSQQQIDQTQEETKTSIDLKKPKKDLRTKFLAKHSTTGQVDSDHEAKRIITKCEAQDALKNHPWRHLIFGPIVNETVFKKHLTLTYRGLVYAKKCLKGPSDKFIRSKQVIVPDAKYPKNRTLLLDLDETLIHSCGLKENPDHVVLAKGDFGEESKIGLKIRPYCIDFLSKLSQLWDIYVFTASSPSYATAIINFLDPEAKYIIGILNRANCMETKNGFFIKDLRILKNKNLKSTVLVDNLAHSFGFQIDNGIPILEWHNDKHDQELKYLLNYLVECAQVEDVRKFNRDRLKLNDLAEAKIEEL